MKFNHAKVIARIIAVMLIFVMAVPAFSFNVNAASVSAATTRAAILSAINAIPQGGSGTVVVGTTTGAWTTPIEITGNRNVTFASSGAQANLTVTGIQRHFIIRNGSTLTINDSNVHIVGRVPANWNATQSSGGGLTGGTTASTLTSNGFGGGIQVDQGATFNLFNGTIRRNMAREGSAVNVLGGIFNMTGGVIEFNRGPNGSAFTAAERPGANQDPNPTTRTSSNHQSGGIGGAVNVWGATAVFNMSDGVIRNNRHASGGGVHVGNRAVFNLSGDGLIEGNRATRFGHDYGGGGVNVIYDAQFNMDDGTIRGNQARENGRNATSPGGTTGSGDETSGGGVHVSRRATFTLNGGLIENNLAHRGGGVYITSGARWAANSDTRSGGAHMVMHGGTIRNNEAQGFGDHAITTRAGGGGVKVHGFHQTWNRSFANLENDRLRSTFTMHGGVISDNLSQAAGGGVYVDENARFDLFEGTISNNRATRTNNRWVFGGGVGQYGVGSTFNMHGGHITNNRSPRGAGVAMYSYLNFRYVDGATFNMFGGRITGNTTTASNHPERGGGGVNVIGNARFNMTGGEISGNTAAYVGGGGVSINNLGETVSATSGGVSNVTNNTSPPLNTGATRINMTGGVITGNTAPNGGGLWWRNIRQNLHETQGSGNQQSRMFIGPDVIIDFNTATNGGGFDNPLNRARTNINPGTGSAGRFSGADNDHAFDNHNIRTIGGTGNPNPPIIIDVEGDRSTTVTAPPSINYEIDGDGANDTGNIYVTFPPDVDEDDVTVNLPENDPRGEWTYDFDRDGDGNLIVIITPPAPPLLTVRFRPTHEGRFIDDVQGFPGSLINESLVEIRVAPGTTLTWLDIPVVHSPGWEHIGWTFTNTTNLINPINFQVSEDVDFTALLLRFVEGPPQQTGFQPGWEHVWEQGWPDGWE